MYILYLTTTVSIVCLSKFMASNYFDFYNKNSSGKSDYERCKIESKSLVNIYTCKMSDTILIFYGKNYY